MYLFLSLCFYPNPTRLSYFIWNFQKIEQSLDKGGMAGRQCVLRAICELTETPIHHWTVFGEMLNNLLRFALLLPYTVAINELLCMKNSGPQIEMDFS